MKELFPSSEQLARAAANSHNFICNLAELLRLRGAVQKAEEATRNTTVLRFRAGLPSARPGTKSR